MDAIRHVRLVPLLLALVANSGCVVAEKYIFSQPAIESKDLSITKSGWLRLDGAVIAVKPANAIMVGEGGGAQFFATVRDYDPKILTYSRVYYDGKLVNATNYFILELLIAPYGDVSLDFRKISLKISPISEIRPSSYFNLAPRYGSSFSNRVLDQPGVSLCKEEQLPSWKADNPLKLTEEVKVDLPLRLQKEKNYCFAIKFDTPPPHPNTTFKIEVNGVNINGEDISLSIRYTPGTYTSQHSS